MSLSTCSRYPPLIALLLPLLALLLAPPNSLCAAERENRFKSATTATRFILLPNNAYGAKCLDGSPPAYYFRAGSGAGRRKWHVHFPQGGWCFSPEGCIERANSSLGSSHFWARRLPAIVENGKKVPNVSRVCPFPPPLPLTPPIPPSAPRASGPDGSPPSLKTARRCRISTRGRADLGEGASVYMQGREIMAALIDDLRTRRGMGAASHVLFSGSSAGGHAIIMHCDRLAAAFPRAQASCLSDSGLFVDAKDRFGQYSWRDRVRELTALHRINVPKCPAGARVRDNWVCFFPEHTLPKIKTPLFLLQFHFDYRLISLENQLPENSTKYETNCLSMQILLPNASAVARKRAWDGLHWNPKFCLPQEVDAVFSMASLSYRSLAVASLRSSRFSPPPAALAPASPPLLSLLLPLLALLLTAPPRPLCAAERGKRVESASATRLVLLRNNTRGAKCLDGSPPAYYFRAGRGAGRRKWHVYLPTGGWCFSPRDCLDRANSSLGSSRFWATRLPAIVENGGAVTNAKVSYPQLGGLLSRSKRANPVFHGWNLVWVVYCDGGAYSSTRGRADLGEGASVYMNGRGILDALFYDLRMKRGMGAASHVLFSGSSAGGHAIIMHCDRLAVAFPRAKATCLADSGFFVDAKDRFGQYYWREKILALTALHPINVPNCPAGAHVRDNWVCFFPGNTLPQVTTPLFLLQFLFDRRLIRQEKQLPATDFQYSTDCLSKQILLPNASAVARKHAWGGLNWSPSVCLPQEVDVVFSMAAVSYRFLAEAVRRKGNLGVMLAPGMGHAVVFYWSWFRAYFGAPKLNRIFNRWFV
ncbi:unnamed protein product [Closterium sp. NIES-65]|nr:unnamed protein product [Closterium sp. NIES-65]